MWSSSSSISSSRSRGPLAAVALFEGARRRLPLTSRRFVASLPSSSSSSSSSPLPLFHFASYPSLSLPQNPYNCLSIGPFHSYPRHHPFLSLMSTPAAGISTAPSSNGGSHTSGVFPLTDSTLLKINKGDITQWFVDGSSDAIVNPANERMLGGGGADGAIHRAAGPELRDACYNVPEVFPGVRCPTGEARITPGFRLPASHVIHTVGPIYDVDSNPQASLKNAYRNCLAVAKDNNIKYIAFPAISCGAFGYPFEESATVAISTIKEFCSDLKEAHFVLFSDDIYNVWLKKAEELLQA